MGFKYINCYNFRNLVNSEINTDSKNIYLVGKNGQGKTNFLEAVYILCYGNSFRTRYDSILLKENENEMSLKGVYSNSEGMENTVNYIVRDKKKEIKLNGKHIKDRKDIIYNIPCIVFAHDDILYVNGTPERRRSFFNQTISLFDCIFLDNIRNYEKIIKNRNIILKEGKKEFLPLYDRQMVETGLLISRKRGEIINEFNKTFSGIFSRVSDIENQIRIVYSPSWNREKGADEIIQMIEGKRDAELSVGSTLTGPHRDRFLFYLSKKDFTRIASTGQLRLISLALKTAQAVFYENKTGKKPLILMDDVLLELDKSKKIKFIESFPDYEQAFFTFLPGEYKGFRENDVMFYTVENGVIKNNEEGWRFT